MEDKKNSTNTIVLYPSPGIGHLVSTVELAKLILHHDPSFSITVLITPVPFNTDSTAPYITRLSSETPSIKFHHLPLVTLPPPSDFVNVFFEIPRLNNPHLRQFLQSITQESKLTAFVIDFFCSAAFQVSSSLNIPTYYFHSFGASGLSVFLYLKTIDRMIKKDIKDLNDYLYFPGTPPIFSSYMPEPLHNRDSLSYKNFISASANMIKSCGIIVNSFETLEPRAVKAIADGICVPDGPTPPVYYLGPISSTGNHDQGADDEDECINWLNSQPSTSVVFLCFGSRGVFDKDQLNDIAIGLENSGQRFLWVVRNPPTKDQTNHNSAPQEPDLNAILPQGFLDRTKERGLVVKSWAPQMAVLNHDSVGGFVTHCGWNSVLEAVCAGVPMLTWPLYAEQKMNKVNLVEELKLALALDELENGFVSAMELEKKVRELMELESGKVVRENVLAMRDAAKAATAGDGCTRVALEKLMTVWKQDNLNNTNS